MKRCYNLINYFKTIEEIGKEVTFEVNPLKKKKSFAKIKIEKFD